VAHAWRVEKVALVSATAPFTVVAHSVVERDSMYYVIAEGQPASDGKPYNVYKFKSLKDAHTAKVVSETAVVYSEIKQLVDFFRKDELDAVWLALNGGKRSFPYGTNGFPSPSVAAEALHSMVLKRATATVPTPQEAPVDPSPVRAATRPKAQPKAKVESPLPNPNNLRIHGDEAIKVLKNFEGREASLRYKNMMLIQASATVEEAVRRLQDADNQEKVARDFVRWATKSGYIGLIAKY